MKTHNLSLSTSGQNFIDITKDIQVSLKKMLDRDKSSGLLNIFCKHTSCALTINEAYDPLAKKDLENFLNHLAPQNLSFIEHTDEGPDDSPSHMKALITGHTLTIPVIDGEIQLGTWQGIYFCEFRDDPKKRNLLLSFLS